MALVVLGAAAFVALRQVQGARYDASSRVLISNQNLAEALTGTQPSFVDPTRVEQTAEALASSPGLYVRAAQETNGSYGTAGELRDATTVSAGGDDILTFSSTSDKPENAVGIANAVAHAYIGWRADILGRAIRTAVADLRAKLSAGRPPANAADLRKQLDTLELMQTLNTDATVIDEASSAGKTRPTPVRDAILGGSIGLLIALLLVAAREAIDTRVRDESDVEDILGTPVLATVRSLPRRTRMVTYGRHEAAYGDTYALLAATLAQGIEPGTPHVLAVTSAVSSEGKTTTAANLAVAFARRGNRVILADFDFRKPALAGLFDLPKNAPGTLNVLAGSAAPADVAWQVVLEGRRPEATPVAHMPQNGAGPGHGGAAGDGAGGKLWLIPAGGSLRSQAELKTARLPQLLQDLRQRADIVVLDTPPALLTVEMAELAGLIDSILVVVRNGRVTHRSLRSLNRQARTWSANVAGVVVTDASGEDQYSYYGSR